LTTGTKRLDIFSVTSPNATDARILVVAGPSGSGKTTFIEA
jgi:ABC-type lipoprotein export system ATPase subunit